MRYNIKKKIICKIESVLQITIITTGELIKLTPLYIQVLVAAVMVTIYRNGDDVAIVL